MEHPKQRKLLIAGGLLLISLLLFAAHPLITKTWNILSSEIPDLGTSLVVAIVFITFLYFCTVFQKHLENILLQQREKKNKANEKDINLSMQSNKRLSLLGVFKLEKPPKQPMVRRCFYIFCLICSFCYSIGAWWAALSPSLFIEVFGWLNVDRIHRMIGAVLMGGVIWCGIGGYFWWMTRIFIYQSNEWAEQHQGCIKMLQFILVSIFFVTMILPVFIMSKKH